MLKIEEFCLNDADEKKLMDLCEQHNSAFKDPENQKSVQEYAQDLFRNWISYEWRMRGPYNRRKGR